MDVETLSRIQFAVTIMFHYIYPPLSIGLGLIMVILEGTWLKTGNPVYRQAARFWTRIFALTFSIGVATGIVMEFEFGTNWSTYSRYVGDVFGSALAAEGVFAFFLESGFLALLLFGWNRIGPKLHFFSTTMVCLGSHFSAVWIVVANSWMHTPAGYHIVGEGLDARAEITDFWAMVFNPSSADRLIHTLIGCWLAGAFLVMSVSAYYLLKKRHLPFARVSLKTATSIAIAACLFQAISGHSSAKSVARNQPAKLAAFEGLYVTTEGAPLTLFGVVDKENKTIKHQVAIPNLLSILIADSPTATVTGLDQYPEADWPKVHWLFYLYRLMIGMWSVMFSLALWTLFQWSRGRLAESRWLLRCLVPAAAVPQIANQAGWCSAEMGRYPWIVQDLLRISDGLSQAVRAEQVLGSLIMFSFVYTLLFALFIFLLDHKIKTGPAEKDAETPYSHLKGYVKRLEK